MLKKKIVLSMITIGLLSNSLYAKNSELEEMKKEANKTYVDYEKNFKEKDVMMWDVRYKMWDVRMWGCEVVKS